MDMFVQQTGCVDPVLGPNSVMGYFDGNTVTALWNYAQHFAISDNFFGTTFGPSTPGLLNLVAGNTFAGTITNGLSAKVTLLAERAPVLSSVTLTQPEIPVRTPKGPRSP
jgi:phospholipase C